MCRCRKLIRDSIRVANLSENERRELARRFLDSAEVWLRRIVHQLLTEAHGDAYFDGQLASGNPIVPKKIRERATARMQEDAARFVRPIDAVTLEDAIKLVLHQEHYKALFRQALEDAYPDGEAEARTFLGRLEKLRNKIAHQGTCSLRELEQAVCYSNDLVDSLKIFFTAKNMQRLYNVPMITRVIDNKGNEFHPPLERQKEIAWTPNNRDLHVGDTLTIEVEVDESFPRDSYDVRWRNAARDSTDGLVFSFVVRIGHVAEQFPVLCEIFFEAPLHRLPGGADDRLHANYRVLPPAD